MILYLLIVYVLTLVFVLKQSGESWSRTIYTILATPFLPVIVIAWLFARLVEKLYNKRMLTKHGGMFVNGRSVQAENLYVEASEKQSYYGIEIDGKMYKVRVSFLRKLEFALFGKAFGKKIGQ